MTKRGSDQYILEYLDHVVLKDIPRLPKTIRIRIKKAVESRLLSDPIGLGKPLRYSFKGHRRLRVGDYRIVYRIDIKKSIVTIVSIKHRKEIYWSL